MPQCLFLLESLETRALLAAGVSSFSAESIIPDQPQCSLSELDNVDEDVEPESLLRPTTGTSKIDHYPESKGWFGDLWDYALTMLGWK